MEEPQRQSESDADRLIKYASYCLDSCMEMYKRLIFRGRLIVVSTTGILTLVATLLAASLDKISGSGPNSITVPLAWALLPGLFGLFKCIQASSTYLLHGEEDTGALPNPVSFGNIGRGWWLTQPTIDTVEEKYLISSLLFTIRWRKRRGRLFRYSVPRNIAHYFMLNYKNHQLKKSIRVLSKHIHRYSDFHRCLMDYYRLTIAYDDENEPDQGYGVVGIRERGATDLAHLISFIIIADIDRKLSDRRRLGKINNDDVAHGKRVFDEYRRRIADIDNAPYILTVDETIEATKENTIELWMKILNLPDELQRDYRGKVNETPDDYLMHKDLDILHHPIFVRGSQYYMQFSEEFGRNECGISVMQTGENNLTGSSRPFSRMTGGMLEALRESDPGHSRTSWRIFMSTYYAAQDKRSANWNTWYRVKLSERHFIEGLCWVLSSISIGVLIFIISTAV